jgi:IPT/TIG domain-containing protein
MTRTLVLFFLLSTSTLFAQPKIDSVSPASGPAAGGTTVIIRGSGFDIACPPPSQPCGRTAVNFGQTEATSFTIINSTTIQAIAPPYLPGTVNVAVSFPNGAVSLPNAFTYTGEVTDGLEPILVPLYVAPSRGAFGSEFVTDFSVWTTGGDPIPLFGLGYPCGSGGIIILCPPAPPHYVTTVRRETSPSNSFGTFGDPGLLIWAPKGAYDRIASSLRVRDLSRRNADWGTALPLVPQREFRSDFLALLDVPMSAGFRQTLRVYSLDRDASVHVRMIRFDGRISREFDLDLRNGQDMFHPSYAQFGDFPVETHNVRIEIQARTASRIWAFAAVTHNETQHITVVTPH